MTKIDLRTNFLTRDELTILLPDEIIQSFSKGGNNRAIYIVNDDVTIEDSRGRSRRAFPHEAAQIRKIMEGQEAWIALQLQIREEQDEFLDMAPHLLLESTDPEQDPNRELDPAQQRLMNITLAVQLGERFGLWSQEVLDDLKQRQIDFAAVVKSQTPATPDPYEEQ